MPSRRRGVPLIPLVLAGLAHAGEASDPAASSRARLAKLVAHRPGLSLNQAREALRVGWGTLYHHVRRLCADGQLRLVRSGRRRLLYPATARTPSEDTLGMLDSPTARRIGERIAEAPGRTILELSEDLDLSPRVVYHHVKRMSAAELVATVDGRRPRAFEPTDALRALLQRDGAQR